MRITIPSNLVWCCCVLLIVSWHGLPRTTIAQPWAWDAGHPAPTTASASRFLLLRNDSVLQGEVFSEPGYYRVRIENRGEVRMPSREVAHVADRLVDLYHFKQAAIERDVVADDVALSAARARLAHWCARQGLREEAAFELSRARALDPTNPMLGVVENQLRGHRQLSPTTTEPPTHPAEQSATVSRRPIGHPSAAEADLAPPTGALPNASARAHVPSLQELDAIARDMPGDTMKIFSQTIQPILSNSCGAADCHGPPSNNGFRITPPHATMPQSHVLTKRNLYETLRWIDRNEPRKSPLVIKPIEPHGGAKDPVFTTQQYAQWWQLATWTLTVAETRNTLSRLSSIGYDPQSTGRTPVGDARFGLPGDLPLPSGEMTTPAEATRPSVEWNSPAPTGSAFDGIGPYVPTPQQRMLQQLRGGGPDPLAPSAAPAPGMVDPATYFQPRDAGTPGGDDPRSMQGAAAAASWGLPLGDAPPPPSPPGPRRGVTRDTNLPRDPFDASAFNNRYFPRVVPNTSPIPFDGPREPAETP